MRCSLSFDKGGVGQILPVLVHAGVLISWAARSGSFATRPDDTRVSEKKDFIPAIYALLEDIF
jgi:hypothetical protein